MKTTRITWLAIMAAVTTATPAGGLDISPTLRDELTNREIGEDTCDLVICVHRWNNDPVTTEKPSC